MFPRIWLAAFLVVLTLGSVQMVRGHGPKHNPVRHHHMMQNGIPETFQNMSNPLSAKAETVALGAALYLEHCASCHGEAGNGHSEAGAELDPPAPELKSMVGMPMITDGYLMWTLSEGGEKLETAMPAFDEVLSVDERWRIIVYMKRGFPSP